MTERLSKEGMLKFYEGNYEHHFKGSNYLMVAHAAGFVGCLSTLKDYANAPSFKGVGVFILIFGLGILASILYYVSIALSRQTALAAVMDGKEPNQATIRFLLIWHLISMGVALLMLVIAVTGLMFKFASL